MRGLTYVLVLVFGVLGLFASSVNGNLGRAVAQGAADPFSAQIMGDVDQPILVLNQEKLLLNSNSGKALLEKENAMKEAHRQEGLRLDKELESEERELTKLRDELVADEFEMLAIQFDTKVVAVRNEHQEKSEALGIELDRLRQSFFGNIVPVVAQIMQERGASLVFEQRNVLFTGPDVDITQDVIDRLDATAQAAE